MLPIYNKHFRLIPSLHRYFIVDKINKTVNKCFVIKRYSYNSVTVTRNHNSLIVAPSSIIRTFCSEVSSPIFERACDETLESLCDFFEDLIEESPHLKSADVTYGDGVLTIQFGEPYGTYVINRQSPNKQIWLSSPTTGPKRYDFVCKGDSDGYWIYKHDGFSLHQLLKQEIKEIVKKEVDLSNCSYVLL